MGEFGKKRISGIIEPLDSAMKRHFVKLMERLNALEAVIGPVIENKKLYPATKCYSEVEPIYKKLKIDIENIEHKYNNQYPSSFSGKLWRSIKDLVISLRNFIKNSELDKEPVEKLFQEIVQVNLDLKHFIAGVEQSGKLYTDSSGGLNQKNYNTMGGEDTSKGQQQGDRNSLKLKNPYNTHVQRLEGKNHFPENQQTR